MKLDARARKQNAARRRELRAWKEENGVSPSTRVFVMDGPAKNPKCVCVAVKDYLEGLGWHHNEAVEPPESLMFDMRFQRLRRRSSRDKVKQQQEEGGGDGESWHANSSSSNGDALAPFQLTNHYTHSGSITTKTGLVRTLNDVRMMGDAEPDDFAPRAYVVNQAEEMAVFYDDYRRVAAECTLFGIVERGSQSATADAVVNRALIDVCEAICARQVAALPDLDEEDSKACGGNIVTPVRHVEWEVLRAAQEQTTEQRGHFNHGWRGVVSDKEIKLPEVAAAPDVVVVDGGVDLADDAGKGGHGSTVAKALMVKMAEKANNARAVTQERERSAVLAKCKQLVPIELDRLVKLRQILARLQKVGGRQHSLHTGVPLAQDSDAEAENGYAAISRQPNCYQGLWIVKPAKLSRGRGIRVFGTLGELLDYVGPNEGVKTRRQIQIGGYMVMKYIERPLTIGRRKWDMRQWVLVASWNPLVVFFNKECYARFAVEEYDESMSSDPTKEKLLGDAPGGEESGSGSEEEDDVGAEDDDDGDGGSDGDDDSDEDDSEKRRFKKKAARHQANGGFVHLVNNSVSKYSDNFTRSFKAENGVEVSGHMLNNEQLADYLKWHSGGEKEVYADIVKPAMSQVAKSVLKCVVAQGQPKQRENSYEVFGFDFFIDEQYKPWLIEINSSPAVDYSTPVTEVYCGEGLVDSVKVGMDWTPWWGKARLSATGGRKQTKGRSSDDDEHGSQESDETDEDEDDETKEAGPSVAAGGAGEVDWSGEPDVGVWECLMDREELLLPVVETDPNRGEKVPKLETTGLSAKTLVVESKQRVRDAKKEEQRKKDRAARAAENRAAQVAAEERFMAERKWQQVAEEGYIRQKTAEAHAMRARMQEESAEEALQGLGEKVHVRPATSPQQEHASPGRRAASISPKFEFERRMGGLAPDGELPRSDMPRSPQQHAGPQQQRLQQNMAVLSAHEHNRVPMRPHAEHYVRKTTRGDTGGGSHSYHLDDTPTKAVDPWQNMPSREQYRESRRYMSRESAREQALAALSGHGNTRGAVADQRKCRRQSFETVADQQHVADWSESPRLRSPAASQRSPSGAGVSEALTPTYLRPSDPTAHLISPGAAAHQAQALQQSLQDKRQALLQREAPLTPVADLKTRLAGRMQQLEHQNRQTPAQYVAMAATAQSRHALGGMRRQWSTEEALRLRGEVESIAASAAGGRPNVTQLEVGMLHIDEKASANYVLRSRIATNAAGVTKILRNSSQKWLSPGPTRARQSADQETAVVATIAALPPRRAGRVAGRSNEERRRSKSERAKTGPVVHPHHALRAQV